MPIDPTIFLVLFYFTWSYIFNITVPINSYSQAPEFQEYLRDV